MQISTSLNLELADTHFRAFIDLIGLTNLRKFAEKYEKLRRMAIFSPSLEELFPIEIGIVDYLNFHRTHHRYPVRPRNSVELRMLTFVVIVNRVNSKLSEHGRKLLSGRLRSCLKNDDGFSSVAHELDLAVHFLKNGCEVEFEDMEVDGGSDLIVSNGEYQIRCECKFFSPEVGRRVKSKDLVNFFKIFESRDLKNHKNLLYKIEVAGNFPSDEASQVGLVEECLSIQEGGRRVLQDGTSMAVQDFSEELRSDKRAVPETTSLNEKMQSIFNFSDETYFVIRRTGGTQKVLALRSKKAASPVRSIANRIKKSARRQLKDDLPNVLAIRFGGLSETDLVSLFEGPRSFFDRFSTEILVRRSSIAKLVAMSSGHIDDYETAIAGARMSGRVVVYDNPLNPHYGEPFLNQLFAASARAPQPPAI